MNSVRPLLAVLLSALLIVPSGFAQQTMNADRPNVPVAGGTGVVNAVTRHYRAPRGLRIAVPRNYFPDDDPRRPPRMTWRSHAYLLYANWLNYCVYQRTPFDVQAIPAEPRVEE